MTDLHNTSGKTAIQQLISRSWNSKYRSQFVRKMELRMCKCLVEFETEMVARKRVAKLEFNHNGSRLVRVRDCLIEVLDPRTQRIVHTLPRFINFNLSNQIFEFTDVDNELMFDCWSMNRNHSELQLWDMRFSSSHVGKISFPDKIMAQYAYSKKERSLLTKICEYSYVSELVLYNKSNFSTSGDATPVWSLGNAWSPTLQATWFGLAPDDSCLVFQPTPESFLAVHNLSFSTLDEAFKQFEDGRLKTMKAPCPIPGGLRVTNKLTHVVHDSQLFSNFKFCPRGNFVLGNPYKFDEIFRVYSFNHDVPTSAFKHNPSSLTSTAQFTASGHRKNSVVPFILSATGEIIIACDVFGTIDFYHLKAPILTEVPMDLKPFHSFTTNEPSSMALSPNLDSFVTGHYSGQMVWYNPRL
ncbi:uncharacterized protein LOC125179402 [Hyalella azteca]|uniref:Uncharacterized protein LOC125179402 n=1 Tax=Hyalella azteca TaxID=294128 RepID=A0A979FV79_HYAAZ|nr:uncharacterized protein LOC125179402 [Hyalella azteca]